MHKQQKLVSREEILSHTWHSESLSHYQLRPSHLVVYCSNCGLQTDHTCFHHQSLVKCSFLTSAPHSAFKVPLISAAMRTYFATGQSSFTILVVCGIFVSFSISPHGGLCGLTCNNPSPVAPLQELVHRSRVVFEGKLQEDGRKRDINRRERVKLLNQRAGGIRNESAVQTMKGEVDLSSESVPNRTSESEPYQVRIRVHQVWEVKAGGLEKDSVVSIVWNRGENCLTLTKDTRYMFFMEPTNDTSVFHAVFPPVETRRAVRKDVSKVLCQECGKCRVIAHSLLLTWNFLLLPYLTKCHFKRCVQTGRDPVMQGQTPINDNLGSYYNFKA